MARPQDSGVNAGRIETPGSDDLLAAAFQFKDEIRCAYSLWEAKKPIVLFHLQEQRIYVYPYAEYKRTLSPRFQAMLTCQYEEALREYKIVVFVQDDERKRLKSFSIDCE